MPGSRKQGENCRSGVAKQWKSRKSRMPSLNFNGKLVRELLCTRKSKSVREFHNNVNSGNVDSRELCHNIKEVLLFLKLHSCTLQ
jgi:hypothetical protein